MEKWFDDKDAVMVDVDFDTLECEMEFVRRKTIIDEQMAIRKASETFLNA